MKLLLDENLPIKLKGYFSEKHQIFTVRELEWSGKKNGELLELMEKKEFEALITIDKSLQHQQNLKEFGLIIIILNSPDNKLSTLEPYIKKLEIILSKPINQNLIGIDI
jgi:predicted nuclease of predicted toxin-antitoxin system